MKTEETVVRTSRRAHALYTHRVSFPGAAKAHYKTYSGRTIKFRGQVRKLETVWKMAGIGITTLTWFMRAVRTGCILLMTHKKCTRQETVTIRRQYKSAYR